jgi:hypothetical protein
MPFRRYPASHKDIVAAGVGVAIFAWLRVPGFELEEIARSLL